MRVLFTVFPATAHVHPTVPLAWALQNAGHEVRFAIHPDAVHLVGEAGLAAVPLGSREMLADAMRWNDNFEMLDRLGDELSLDTADDSRWDWQWSGLTGMLGMFTPMVDDLVDFCRRWGPDLVIWDPFCVAAGVAARVTGAAHARFLWGQDNIGWLRAQARRRLTEGADDPVITMMQPMLDRHGLSYSEDLLLGQWTIDPMPPAMRLPLDIHYVPIRRVPYNGNAMPPSWVHDRPERPRVALSLGIGGRGRQLFKVAGVTFAEVVSALAGMDVELVATLHSDVLASAGQVPDNVRLAEYIPLSYLLPNCSAVIHHGGGGTFAAAVAARVPQLITPMPFWSEATTARVAADSGAALLLEPAELSTQRLVEQVTRLLTEPQFPHAAELLWKEINKMPSPAETVTTLQSLTEQNRG